MQVLKRKSKVGGSRGEKGETGKGESRKKRKRKRENERENGRE